MNYYNHHIGDFIRDTAYLSACEEGIYRRALDWYYLNEKPLPFEKKLIYKYLRAKNKLENNSVDIILSEFFILKDDGYHHSRCDKEIDIYQAKAVKNKENGAKGGRPKKEPNDNPPETTWDNFGFPNETDCEPKQKATSNHKPIYKEQEHVHASEDAPILKPEKFKDESQSVFEHWTKVMGKNASTKFTPDRKRLIVRNLKEGYTVDQLKTAIDGCYLSDFNMGREQGKPRQYNDIELILRDAKHIEDFTALKNASSPSTNGNVARTVSEQDQKILDMINAPIQTGRGRK